MKTLALTFLSEPREMPVLASILNPNDIIASGGVFLVAAIIFAESCLIFFLPGDSLLFIAGFLATKPAGLPHVNQPLLLIIPLFFLAAALGDQVGYVVGRRIGTRLFTRPNSRLFNPKNLAKAQAFFDRHGSKTIVMARFVPVVRTFTPMVAGVSEMPYRRFVTFNLMGGAAWTTGLTVLGYFLGKQSIIRNHVELATIGIVVFSLLPIGVEYLRHRRSGAGESLVS